MLTVCNNCGNKFQVEYSRSDNVVAIKRELCKQIYKNEIDIELFDGDNKLDNNLFIPDGRRTFKYVELNGQSGDFILKVVPNDLLIPNLLQVNKNENAYEFRQKIKELFKLEDDIVIYFENSELDDLKTLAKNNLVDDCEIVICKRENRNLTLSVTNLLPCQETHIIQCFIFDLISVLKEKICAKFGIGDDADIFLFSKTNYLEKDKILINYRIQNEDLIFFVNLERSGEIEILNSFKSGEFADVLEGKILTNNKRIALKKYDFKNKKIHDFKPVKYEIIIFLKLRSENSEFVKLETMFEKDSNFYIGMEYMEGGSLDGRIPLMDNRVIIKYSIQLLKALAYLHKNRIIFRNMKCSSILLDKDDNIKLCNFHMSKYLMDCDTKQLVEGILGSKPINYNWAAPEMIAGKPYGSKADIWSFGATLIEIVIGEPPYNNLKPATVKSKIIKTKSIEYDFPGYLSRDIENLINLSISPEPNDRPTAEQLLEHVEKIKI